jgi:hypothetical protein
MPFFAVVSHFDVVIVYAFLAFDAIIGSIPTTGVISAVVYSFSPAVKDI